MIAIAASLGFGFLIIWAILAGRSLDAGRERRLRQLVASERRLLGEERRRLASTLKQIREERRWLSVERERYREAVRKWRRVRDEEAPGGETRDDWEIQG